MISLTHFVKGLFARFQKPSHSLLEPVDLSFSRIQSYLRCPWMYHLVYSLGWRAGPNSGMALGMSLHRTLAAYHASDNPEKSLNRLLEIYDQMWVNEGFQSTQETLDMYDQGRKMLELYFELDQNRRSEVIATEKEFEVPIASGIRFHGTVDRLDRFPDGSYEIVEYKTQNQHWTQNRMETDLQMTLYDLGLRKELGCDSLKLKYIFLSSSQSVNVQRSQQQLDNALSLMNNIASRIRKKDFNPNFDHCPKCEFSNRCTYYRKPNGKQ